MDWESVEDVLSRQRAQDFGLMDWPICREAVKVKPKYLDRRGICRETIEDAKKRFSKGGKTHKMRKQQDGYSNKHPSNMLSTQTTP